MATIIFIADNCKLVDTPTAEAVGFLLLPLLHWLVPYSTTTSYTVSTSEIILFPYALRCSFMYLCWLQLQSFMQDIYTCINISLMLFLTVRAFPCTNCKIFYQWIFITTTGTGLTTWVHGWYFYDIISVPCSLIGKHIEKLTPWCRTDMLCQFMISNHVLYL